MILVGLAELIILNAPGYAAVNTAVESVRRLARPRAAGLVNAVLRNTVRAMERGKLPDPLFTAEEAAEADASARAGSGADAGAGPGSARDTTTDTLSAEVLADGFSFPSWVAERWVARMGASEAAQMMRASNRVPSYGLRPSGGLSLQDLARELARRDWRPILHSHLRVFCPARQPASQPTGGGLEALCRSAEPPPFPPAAPVLPPQPRRHRRALAADPQACPAHRDGAFAGAASGPRRQVRRPGAERTADPPLRPAHTPADSCAALSLPLFLI